VEFRLLGPLEVTADGVVLELGPRKQRATLALLALHRGTPVSTATLTEALWGACPPAKPTASVQAYVSNLRKLLRCGPAVIHTRPGGYLLAPGDAVFDVDDFLSGHADAERHAAAGQWAQAAVAAEAALRLWRAPLPVGEEWPVPLATRLIGHRSALLELLATACLAIGRAAEAAGHTAELVRAEPDREQVIWLHALALFRTDRVEPALELLRAFGERRAAAGLEPSDRIRELQTAILRRRTWLDRWPRRQGDEAPASPEGLVGRELDCREAAAVLDEAAAGVTSWLLLTGQPGIGKSALADHTLSAARARRAGCGVAHCSPETPPAWWVVRRLLRTLGGDPGEILGIEAATDVDRTRFGVYERVGDFLVARARTGLVHLTVEDVHWADAASVACLAHLARTLRGLPVSVVVTARTGHDITALATAIAQAERSRQLIVGPLAPDDIAVLAERIQGQPLTDDERVSFLSRTGGVPLFVCEFARLPAPARAAGEIPPAVRSILSSRLAALGRDAREVLEIAAVAGDAVDVESVVALTGRDREAIVEAVHEAIERSLAVCRVSDGVVVFAHGLVRSQLVAELPVHRRRQLHLRLAERHTGGDPDTVQAHAHHLRAALPLSAPAEVAKACRKAAQTAERTWSSDTAAHWWDAALLASMQAGASATERDELLSSRVAALVRAGRGSTASTLIHDALLDAVRGERWATVGKLAGTLLRSAGSWPWVTYGDTDVTLLERLAGIATLVPDHTPARPRLLATIAAGRCYHPDPRVPEALHAEATALVARWSDPDVLGDVLMGRVLYHVGRTGHHVEVPTLLDRLAELGHHNAAVDRVLGDAIMVIQLFTHGDVAGAQAHLARAIAGSDARGLPVSRVQLRWAEGLLAQWHGDLDRAERLYRVADSLHAQTELYTSGSHDIALAGLRRDQGRLAELALAPDAWAGPANAAARGNIAVARDTVSRRLADRRSVTWARASELVLLADTVCDLGLCGLVEETLGQLAPHTGLIANAGFIGLAGPIDLAIARLRLLIGDREGAKEALAAATMLSSRASAGPALRRCRALADRLRAGA
jgi:DNA-binding SARP family transcriptional activator